MGKILTLGMLEKMVLDQDKEILELRATLDRLEQAEIQDLKNKLGELERDMERGFSSIPREVDMLRRY